MRDKQATAVLSFLDVKTQGMQVLICFDPSLALWHLVGGLAGLEHFLFFRILGIIIPTD